MRLDATGPDGGATTFTGGVARIYALSTPTTPGFYLAEGGTVLLSDNNWHTMTFRLNGAEFIDPSFDPTNVVQIGVHIATPPPVSADAAVPPYGAPQPSRCTSIRCRRTVTQKNLKRQDARVRTTNSPDLWRPGVFPI